MIERQGSGGGESRPPLDELVLHEEEATVDKQWQGVGTGRVGRKVETEHVTEDHPRWREELEQQRVPPGENDSGEIETLADGSISIPLYEEELVVTRRTVLRERVIIRKEDVTEWLRVEADLRRERLHVEMPDK